MAKKTIQAGDVSQAVNGVSGNRVFVSVSKTVNLGNFESLRVEVGFGRSVEDGQTFKFAFEQCKQDSVIELNGILKTLERK